MSDHNALYSFITVDQTRTWWTGRVPRRRRRWGPAAAEKAKGPFPEKRRLILSRPLSGALSLLSES